MRPVWLMFVVIHVAQMQMMMMIIMEEWEVEGYIELKSPSCRLCHVVMKCAMRCAHEMLSFIITLLPLLIIASIILYN